MFLGWIKFFSAINWNWDREVEVILVDQDIKDLDIMDFLFWEKVMLL